MDITFIYGPNSSGKSSFAESLVVESGIEKRYYFATMVCQNSENEARIEKHRKMRAGKGFETRECPFLLSEEEIDPDSIVLLEDASNLLANGLFEQGKNADDAMEQIKVLSSHCKKLIIVSIGGLKADGFDEDTAHYINELNRLNTMLETISAETFRF